MISDFLAQPEVECAPGEPKLLHHQRGLNEGRILSDALRAASFSSETAGGGGEWRTRGSRPITSRT
jgi:hypothetical protein